MCLAVRRLGPEGASNSYNEPKHQCFDTRHDKRPVTTYYVTRNTTTPPDTHVSIYLNFPSLLPSRCRPSMAKISAWPSELIGRRPAWSCLGADLGCVDLAKWLKHHLAMLALPVIALLEDHCTDQTDYAVLVQSRRGTETLVAKEGHAGRLLGCRRYPLQPPQQPPHI